MPFSFLLTKIKTNTNEWLSIFYMFSNKTKQIQFSFDSVDNVKDEAIHFISIGSKILNVGNVEKLMFRGQKIDI